LKQNITISNVEIKNFIVILLHLDDKKLMYIPSHRFLDHLKWIKNEKNMGFENKKG
jgi:hypothetical protein